MTNLLQKKLLQELKRLKKEGIEFTPQEIKNFLNPVKISYNKGWENNLNAENVGLPTVDKKINENIGQKLLDGYEMMGRNLE